MDPLSNTPFVNQQTADEKSENPSPIDQHSFWNNNYSVTGSFIRNEAQRVIWYPPHEPSEFEFSKHDLPRAITAEQPPVEKNLAADNPHTTD